MATRLLAYFHLLKYSTITHKLTFAGDCFASRRLSMMHTHTATEIAQTLQLQIGSELVVTDSRSLGYVWAH